MEPELGTATSRNLTLHGRIGAERRHLVGRFVRRFNGVHTGPVTFSTPVLLTGGSVDDDIKPAKGLDSLLHGFGTGFRLLHVTGIRREWRPSASTALRVADAVVEKAVWGAVSYGALASVGMVARLAPGYTRSLN